MSIYSRLENDVWASLYPDVYLLNQEDQINEPNTFQVKGWKYYRDGGAVRKNTSNYSASYTFDHDAPYAKSKKTLRFVSYSGSSGINLLNFIESVLKADPKLFVKWDGFVVKDARKYLFDLATIRIVDSVIDHACVETLKRYFHHLEKIEFWHCKLLGECSFDKLDVPLKFTDCEVDDIRCFNGCKANLDFHGVIVNKITPTTIQSKKINMSLNVESKTINSDIKSLFLKCNLPELEVLTMRRSGFEDSFEDAFRYLPDAAPNLEEIQIESKVKDLDFLTKLKHLRWCLIASTQDHFYMDYTYVTDGKERKRILKRNQEGYQIQKILNPYQEDKFIIGELEKERIKRLSHFFSTLDYTEEDIELFMSDRNANIIPALLQKTATDEVKKYYVCYGNELYLKKTPNTLLDDMVPNYRIMHNKFLYEYHLKYSLFKNILYLLGCADQEELIVKAKNFIYGPNGLPILFQNQKKPIRTVKQAEDFMKDKEIKPFDIVEHQYREFMRELKSTEGKISVGALIDSALEEYQISVNESTFKKLDGSKKICAAFFQYERAEKRLDEIQSKNEQYGALLSQLIADNYALLTVPEKAYLYMHQYDNTFSNPVFLHREFEILYPKLVTDEDAIVESINRKTNGLYHRYCEFLRVTYCQRYMLGKPYDIEIEEDAIKELVI